MCRQLADQGEHYRLTIYDRHSHYSVLTESRISEPGLTKAQIKLDLGNM